MIENDQKEEFLTLEQHEDDNNYKAKEERLINKLCRYVGWHTRKHIRKF